MLMKSLWRVSLVSAALTFGLATLADDEAVSLAESRNLFEVIDLQPGENARDQHAPKRIYIWLAERIDKGSFRAMLNGRDVTDRFDLSDTGIQLVKLPFGNGRNRLEISAAGSEYAWHRKDDRMDQAESYELEFAPVRTSMLLAPERVDEAVAPADVPGKKN